MHGCALDDVYYCPHAPDREPPCECRKPGLGMYRKAAERHGIDLSRALYVGDKVTDVLPALEVGGTCYLVRTGQPADEDRVPDGCRVGADLWQVVVRAFELSEREEEPDQGG